MPIKTLAPIKESSEDFENIEESLKLVFRKHLYEPLLKQLNLPKNTIRNAPEDLLWAIQKARITFYRGKFSGKFNASISQELRKLGARWNRKTGTYDIGLSSLPIEVRNAISAGENKFLAKIAEIDKHLATLVPEKIAEYVQVQRYFDASLWKVEDKFQDTVKKLVIAPKLTKAQAKQISDEWNNNMQLWIQDFTAKEIKRLRGDVQASVFTGNRYDSLAKSIERSYEVSANKAKFLARQETGLLMAKHKQTRYESAGVDEYIWTCVVGSPKHPVRPAHKALDGKVFKWKNPPITDDKGNRNNPGQDYNCRCFARPVVRFK